MSAPIFFLNLVEHDFYPKIFGLASNKTISEFPKGTPAEKVLQILDKNQY
jgi:hypothetical protein